MASANGDSDRFVCFEEKYVNEKLKDFDSFLSYMRNVSPKAVPDSVKSKFNNIYTKCGYLSTYWDTCSKVTDNENNCKTVDDSLWQDNLLLKYLYMDFILCNVSKLTGELYLYCIVCNESFSADPLDLICHLNEETHLLKYTEFKDKREGNLWKNCHTYKHANRNFIDFRFFTIYCKICGISLPLSHNYLISHLKEEEHKKNFEDIASFKLNKFSSLWYKSFNVDFEILDKIKIKDQLNSNPILIEENKSSKVLQFNSSDHKGSISNENKVKLEILPSSLVSNEPQSVNVLKMTCFGEGQECENPSDSLLLDHDSFSYFSDKPVEERHGLVFGSSENETNLEQPDFRSNCDNSEELQCSLTSRSDPYRTNYMIKNPIVGEHSKKPAKKFDYKLVLDNIQIFDEQFYSDLERHNEFMDKINKQTDKSKLFCQLCHFYDISYNAVYDHESSHIPCNVTLNQSWKQYSWQFCEFCCVKLFCTGKLLLYHYRHFVHKKYVLMFIVKNKFFNAGLDSLQSEFDHLLAKFNENKGNEHEIKLEQLTYIMSRKVLRKSDTSPVGYFCYPCCYTSTRKNKWQEHIANHRCTQNRYCSMKSIAYFCNCFINLFCESEFYAEHQSSVNHFNLISFLNKEFVESTMSAQNTSLVYLGGNGENLKHSSGIQRNSKLETEPNSEEPDFLKDKQFRSSFEDSSDFEEIKSNAEVAEDVQGASNFNVSDSMGIKNLNRKTRFGDRHVSKFQTFFNEVDNSSNIQLLSFLVKEKRERKFHDMDMHDKFMTCIETETNCVNIFCQLCGFFKRYYLSTGVVLNHKNSPEHCTQMEKLIRYKKYVWRRCEFCFSELFCDDMLLSYHYRHPKHDLFVANRVIKDDDHTNSCKIVALFLGNNERKYSFNETLNEDTKLEHGIKLMCNSIIRQFGKNSKCEAQGFVCCPCNYTCMKEKKMVYAYAWQ